MSVDKTNRPPDFESDVEKYGAWGEDLFADTYASTFEKRGYALYNVTKSPFFQERDIDFVVAKSPLYSDDYDGLDNGKKFPDELDESMNETVMSSCEFEKIEVKVDTRTIDTGNIPYEMISHAQLGWCLRTQCDKVYFIVAKEEGDNLTPVRALWLDMAKWREFIADKKTSKISNLIRGERGIADLLCKETALEKYGVILSKREF